ncbi:hypothetical protein D3C86_1685230 [compost metagenome]
MPQDFLKGFARPNAVGVEKDVEAPCAQQVMQLNRRGPGFGAAVADEDPTLPAEQADALEKR